MTSKRRVDHYDSEAAFVLVVAELYFDYMNKDLITEDETDPLWLFYALQDVLNTARQERKLQRR